MFSKVLRNYQNDFRDTVSGVNIARGDFGEREFVLGKCNTVNILVKSKNIYGKVMASHRQASPLRQLFQVIMSTNAMDDVIRSIVYVFLHLLYMFLTNYAGQQFIDHDAIIYEKMYVSRMKQHVSCTRGHVLPE